MSSKRPMPKGLRPARAALSAAFAVLVAASCGGEGRAEGAAGEEAPDSFLVSFETSQGEMRILFHRAWSPAAVDRVLELVELGFWDGARFYRVNEQYAQFGFSGRPDLDSAWMDRRLPDEPVRASNLRGTVTFARAGPRSRNFVLFLNLVDNTFLDTWAGDGAAGFPPIGRVVEGLEVAGSLESSYGDAVVPLEDSILARGNAFLDERFPGLDSVVSAEVVERW